MTKSDSPAPNIWG